LLVLSALKGDAGAEQRGVAAVRGVDAMLVDLDFDLRARLDVMESLRTSFLREFEGHPELSRRLGQQYRRRAARIGWSAKGDGPGPGTGESAESIVRAADHAFARRSEAWRPAAARLRELERKGRLGQPLTSIAASLAHMHCNRMMRSAARAHELVFYDVLCREYRTRLARDRQLVAASGADGG
jgi:thiopeptide-type bacteriocin biosynthesis protein